MPLAQRTRKHAMGSLPGMNVSRPSVFGPLALEAHIAAEEGLPSTLWQHLHVRYVPTLPSAVFRRYALVPGYRVAASKVSATSTCNSRDSEGEVEARLSGREVDWSPGYIALDAPSPPQHSDDVDCLGPAATTILPPSVRLRLLLSLVADDLPGALGERGPGLKLDQWRKPKLCNFLLRTFRNFGMGISAEGSQLLQQLEVPNAFLLYFLMQDPRDAAYLRLCDKFGHPGSPHFQQSLFTAVVDPRLPGMLHSYFDHQIAFYFAFLQHLFNYGFALSVLLAPLLAIYSVDWAQHVVATLQKEQKAAAILGELVHGLVSEIDSSEAAQGHWPLWSLLVGLSTIVWGQCVIDSWRRKERRLAKEWGSSRGAAAVRAALRTPRPLFRGRIALSQVDGRLTQVHYSKRRYQVRVFALNLAFLLLAVAFAAAVFLAIAGREARVASEEYASLGAVYSIMTVALHNLFKSVANLLTEAENHQYEEPREASVLVKKWMLTVIVQCWPLGHLLFLRPLLWPCAYGDVDVRQRLGIDTCSPGDYECCNVELWRADELMLSFAHVRSEAVLRHTRQFVAGWLVSKVFVANLIKWFVPRLCGFLCTRGLYPLFALDFVEDLLNDLTLHSNSRRRRRVRVSRCSCCRRRKLLSSKTQLRAHETGPSALPEEVTAACELQLDKEEPWDLLESANDLSVHFLVTSLTTVIYPFAPPLLLAHLLVGFQMDLFRLFDRRQPKPRAASGLPEAWLWLFQSYVYVGALSNLALVTWRTPLIRLLLGQGDSAAHFAFFSASMLLLALVVGLVHLVVPSMPGDVVEHLQREQEVEAFITGATGLGGGRRHTGSRFPTQRAPTVSLFRSVSFGAAESAALESQHAFLQEEAQVRSIWKQAQKVR